MAAEAGAELSGLEFTGIYTVAPAGTPMTRAMAYAWADYFDESGRQIDVLSGDATRVLAKALMQGKVVCSLARMPEDLRARVHTISPNVTTAWTRQGIDPWNDRFEITLHGDGTIRGPGGVRVADEDCGVGVPGLYAVGDAASRELITGANSGGGAQNAAWALSSGVWAGQAAVRHAMQRGLRKAGPGRQGLEALGRVGLRPAASTKALDVKALIAAVQAQVLPYERNLFRTGTGLAQSGRALDMIWAELHDHAGGSLDASAVWSGAGDALLRVREAAALAATARWSVAAAQARTESRGPLHRREDFPETDARQAHRLLAQGFGKGADAMRVWPDAQVDTARQGLEALETA
jgi:L-aspartate oxidase